MKICVHDGLPFTKVLLKHQGKSVEVDRVLTDSGSAGTVFDADELAKTDLLPESDDVIRTVFGIGGTEFVVEKNIDQISLMSLELKKFPIEIGSVDYGFEMKGIFGFNFLVRTKAVIDLGQIRIYSGKAGD
ncbi:aspartyl protease family protein [Desulfobacterales bacterium HSG2]|nr:aspartyl protease family protein [Desulfobacterales bacterium HSG2]